MAEGRKRSFTEFSEEEPPLYNGGVGETQSRLKPEGEQNAASVTDDGFQPVVSKSKRRKKKSRKSGGNGVQSLSQTADTNAFALLDQVATVENDAASPSSNGQAIVIAKAKDNRPGLQFMPHRINSKIKLANMQELLLYCLADGVAPSWISVRNHNQIRRAVVLFVPGLEQAMFSGKLKLDESAASKNGHDPADREEEVQEVSARVPDESEEDQSKNPDDYLPTPLNADLLPAALKPLAEVFPDLWPVKAPGDDRYCKLHSPLHAMLTCPIPKSAEKKKLPGPKPASMGPEFKPEPMPVVSCLLTLDDMQENEYVVHPAYTGDGLEEKAYWADREAAQTLKEHGWLDSPIKSLEDGKTPNEDDLIAQGSLIADRKVYALDCEMCMVGEDDYALTRLSVVEWDGEVLLDELVKPDKPITDYVTRFSGITKEMIDPVTTSLKDVQQRLLGLLTPQSILVGHSLNSDLQALKLTHPFIVDTAILYPHPRGPPLKSSLKWLAQKYLGREIQKGDGATGHDSIEDARACLGLVRQECEKGPLWGTSETSNEPIFKRLSRSPKANSISTVEGQREGKVGAIVDVGGSKPGFRSMAPYFIACSSDAAMSDAVRRCVLGDTDGAYIPGDGVELTWARFRSLEKLRGWVSDNRGGIGSFKEPETNGNNVKAQPEPSPKELDAVISEICRCVKEIRDFLPPCTLLMLYSGTGDPRPLVKLQEMQRKFKKEFNTKKWDELSVKWTDVEEQALKSACKRARRGLGMMTVT